MAYMPLSFCGPVHVHAPESCRPSKKSGSWRMCGRPSITSRLALFGNVAQPPADQRHGARDDGLDHALLDFRGHQRNVTIEDRCAHRVLCRGDAHLPPRAARSRNRHRGRMSRGALLDFRPRRRVRLPDMRRGLLRRQLRQFVRIGDTSRVDLADPHALAARRQPHCRRAVRERNLDIPRAALLRIPPQKGGRGKVRRKDRSLLRIIDDDARRLLRRRD